MSLLEVLTGPHSTVAYAATAVSGALIQAAAEDVCSYHRNNQVSYRVVEKLSEVRRKIDQLIGQVETASANDAEAWNKFERYSDAIDPLDQALFELVLKTSADKAVFLPKFEENPETIEPCVIFSDAWIKQRKDLRELLAKLQTTFKDLLQGSTASPEPQEDIKTVYEHDDIRYLSDIIVAIKSKTPAALGISRGTVASYITNIRKGLDGVSATFAAKWHEINDDSQVMIVKATMLIYGIMEFISASTVDAEKKAKARSEVVWKAAELLVKKCDEHMTKKDSLEALKAAYDDLKRLLGVVAGLPDNFIELRKHTGRIGRRYYSRALYLIKLCRELAEYFEKTAAVKTANNQESLAEAIDATIDALRKAAEHDIKVLTFALDQYEADKTVVNLSSACDKIKACFSNFGITDRWAEREKELTERIATDKNRIQQVNDRIQVFEVKEVKKESINLKLTVQEGDKNQGTVEYTVMPSTRLSAVQWLANKDKKFSSLADKIMRPNSFFAKSGSPKVPLFIHDEVKSHVSGQSCDLLLVIPSAPKG